MKNFIYAAIIAASSRAAVSCSQDTLEDHLTDRSFDFSVEVAHDISSSQHCLTLHLDKASDIDETYTFDFEIDGNKSMTLSTMDNKPIGSSLERGYKTGDTETFILPELCIGEHEISVRAATAMYSISKSLTFRISNPAFSIHAETDTNDFEKTSIILTLQDGEPRELFLDMILDESAQLCLNKPADFRKGMVIREYLPILYPGWHTVRITVHDDILSESIDLKFNEPARDKQICSSIYLDDDGRIMMNVSSNTYGVRIHAESSLTVTGICRWWENGPVIYNDSPSELLYHKSDTLSICSKSFVSFHASAEEMILRRNSLVSELESHHKSSAIWKKEWDPSSEGGWFYHVVGYTSEHYKLASELLEMNICADLPSGVTLSVSSHIDNTVINGKSIPKGKSIRIESTQSNQ